MEKIIDYLGDGVYALQDDYGIWLYANSHENPTDKIYLAPSVLKSLNIFAKKINSLKNKNEGE